jgi:cytochrome c554/c'-like protein
VNPSNAVGDATCISCHRDKATFEQTAHHLTTRPPTRGAIAASFRPGENILATANPALRFRMDSTDSGFYQTAIVGVAPDTTTQTHRFDFVAGSGRKGQSYLWHDGDRLYQLPVSYWVGIGWINSPGYRDGTLNFDRPIPPRCLECHSAGFESVPGLNAANRYNLTTPMLGIACETCHTAGQAHVRRERSVLRVLPRALVPSGIVNPAKLPRARRIDQCALCHGGALATKTPAFTYVPGEPLAEHLDPSSAPFTSEVDVHGNQVALLERSKCFQRSQMTCATCHDAHQTQRDVAALSGKCLTCHPPQSKTFPHRGQSLEGKCVDCHMPKLASNLIISTFQGQQERPLVRTHWIKVYPEQVAR